jgi:hypothetical protein
VQLRVTTKSLVYTDAMHRLTVRSLHITKVRFHDTSVTLFGTARQNGKRVTFTAIVNDRGRGTRDTFRLTTSAGLDVLRRLSTGNLIVR